MHRLLTWTSRIVPRHAGLLGSGFSAGYVGLMLIGAILVSHAYPWLTDNMLPAFVIVPDCVYQRTTGHDAALAEPEPEPSLSR